MALTFREGNPSKKGKPSTWQSQMFLGFVARMEQRNPAMVHAALDQAKVKAREFARHQNIDLSEEALMELEGAFNSWFFLGLMEGIQPGSFNL